MVSHNDLMVVLGEVRGDLGEVRGELKEIRKLIGRVSDLERWQSWLKGGWAVLAAALVWLLNFTR